MKIDGQVVHCFLQLRNLSGSVLVSRQRDVFLCTERGETIFQGGANVGIGAAA